MCNVRDIDVLIAIVSVIRPGAANMNRKSDFALRAQGLQEIDYTHPSLSKVLRSTFGVVAYEEHILQICEAFADMPAGRADMLRRALGEGKGSRSRKDAARILGLRRAPWAHATGDRGGMGSSLWISGVCLLSGAQHRLRRGSVPSRPPQALSPCGVSWGRPDP
jgi:hypothetical protein